MQPLKVNIPLAYAGQPYAPPTADDEPITLHDDHGAHEYRVIDGYLVPYYPRTSMGEDTRRRNEELVIDRATKFFYMAEPNLDVLWTHDEIENAKTNYLNCTDTELKKIRGRHLVGAMVNRMARLARVYLENGETRSVKIDLNEEQAFAAAYASSNPNEYGLDTLEPIRKEFSAYYSFLMVGAGKEIFNDIRFRDYSTDYDGILLDLIREIGKPMMYLDESSEKMGRSNITHKIAHTCESIDQVHAQMKRIAHQPKVLDGLERARKEYTKKLLASGANISDENLDRINQPYLKILKEFTALSRARATLRSEDAENFSTVREQLTLLEQQLYDIHATFRRIARLTNQPALSEARDLLERSVKLMLRASEARTPINHHAPTASSQPEQNAQSSVARLSASVDYWVEKAERTNQEAPAR